MTLPTADDIKTIIAAPCLVAIDRAGRALFISDYERRLGDTAPGAADRLTRAGYTLTPLPGGMTLVDWPRDKYLCWFDTQPEYPCPPENDRVTALCRMLKRHPARLDEQDAAVLSQALRLALLGSHAKLCDLLEGAFAEALRQRRAVPYHGARALNLSLFTICCHDERSAPC